NRESNLAPILRDKHKEKTAHDINEKSKVARLRAKHFGLWPKSHFRTSAKTRPNWATNDRQRFCRELAEGGPLEQEEVSTPDVDAFSSCDRDPKGEQ
ncbi:MAG: hypothetical protein ABWY13_11535, partial [Mesorhizobium sp.]